MKTQRELLTVTVMVAIVATICLYHVASAHQNILHVNTVIFARSGDAKDALTPSRQRITISTASPAWQIRRATGAGLCD